MHQLSVFMISAALLCSTSAFALEMSASNDVRNLNSGFEQRLEATKNALTAAFNSLKGTIDDIVGRLGVVESDIVLIKNNGANDEVHRWNPKLEVRLDNIESINASQTNAINTATTTNNTQDNRLTALENAPKGGLVYARTVDLALAKGSSSSAVFNHTFCVLTRVQMSTTEDNHSHSCTITRSAAGYQLSKAGTKGSQGCTMMCFD